MSFSKQQPPSARQQAVKWLVSRHSGRWTQVDQANLDDWLNMDATHRHAFEQARLTWNDMGNVMTENTNHITAARQFGSSSWRLRLTQSIAPGIAIATGCAVFAVLVAMPWWEGEPKTYLTQRGEHRNITLKDGSKIALNADSELSVRIGHGQRQVQLKNGEALFTVIHDDARPFTVHAGAGEIRDVGTIFNVESRYGQVTVAVLEGEINVTGDITRSPAANLVASQGVGYDATGLLTPITTVQSEDVLAWREWKLVFHDQPLQTALLRLSPYHDVRFDIPDQSLAAMRISGSFSVADLNLFLKTLTTAFPIRAKIIDVHHIKLQRVAS